MKLFKIMFIMVLFVMILSCSEKMMIEIFEIELKNISCSI